MLEKISVRERRDLIIAWLAISIAFTLIFIRPSGKVIPEVYLLFFGVSLVTVGIGFVLHEMAHKFTAMKYGFWAEFRRDNLMLVVAVALAALVGVVFAAPGATMIYGPAITRQQNGRISAAGPVTNLVLCVPFGILLFVGQYIPLTVYSLNIISLIGLIGLQVNAMIAFFNMLPVSVLDGKKVWAWNKGIFAALFIAALGAVVFSYYYIYL
jgi:Zn-dependent protease